MGFVVVGADKQAGLLVALVQRHGHGLDVARVEGHGHRKLCRFVQRGSSSVALGHQDDGAGQAHQVKVALGDKALGPVFFLQALALALSATPTDDLQALDLARRITQRDGHGAAGGEPNTVGPHRFA